MKAHTQKQETGFTLIEVMVALLIFAFAASSLTVGFQSSTNASIRAEQNLQANLVAQYQIEANVLSGNTNEDELNSIIKLDMFDKSWTIKQTLIARNDIEDEQAEQSIALEEIEDDEIYSDSFDSDGSQQDIEEFEIRDTYLIYTVEVTPEDEIGHAFMQTLLIKGLIQ